MKAKFVGGPFNGIIMDIEEIKKNWNGELTADLSSIRARGGLVRRAELDNQPKFVGYVGPMWDGNMLRYESNSVYEVLSR